jgi:cellulose synthase (UDP-forming)
VPNEGSLFYGTIQDGNDLWNAAFFCGSCAVLRRESLQEVGGFSVETVTEDAHTALKFHRHGYTTAYLSQALAGGLATENLAAHIGQRMRWARGMAQIFRLDNPLTGEGLTLVQRLCYANSMLHFFSAFPRLIFLIAPLMYLYFELHIINAAAVTLAAYAVPHIVHSTLANSHVQGRFRHSFWNEAYEIVLSWYIALPTAIALIDPRRGKFNVTAKGGLVEQDFFDWRTAGPYVVLALLNFSGALIAIPRLLFWNTSEADTVIVNLVWTLFNLIPLGAVIGAAAESRQVRAAHRVGRKMTVTLYTADGAMVASETEDFSMLGVGLTTDSQQDLKPGEQVALALTDNDVRFPARVVAAHGTHIGLALDAMPLDKEREYVRHTFASPTAWADWGKTAASDRPLASLAEMLSISGTGYLRLFDNIATSLLCWWDGKRVWAT